LGGRILIFKSSEVGGSLVIGTPTGVSAGPVRYDTMQTGAGLLAAGSLVPVSNSLVFYLGHDGFYLYDGARGVRSFEEGVARSLAERVNYNAIQSAFAVYHPVNREILLGLPVDGTEAPSEFWTIDPFKQRVYGPWTYADTLLAADFYSQGGQLTWNTLDGRSTGRDWTSLQDTAGDPYATWTGITDANVVPNASMIFGIEDGNVYQDDGSSFSDNGTGITGHWESPAVTSAGRSVLGEQNKTVPIDAETLMTLRGITVRYKDQGSWTPQVQYSIDGGSVWNTISDGNPVGTTSGRIRNKTYRTLVPSTWFQFRIGNTTGGRFGLHSVLIEMTRAGNERHL